MQFSTQDAMSNITYELAVPVLCDEAFDQASLDERMGKLNRVSRSMALQLEEAMMDNIFPGWREYVRIQKYMQYYWPSLFPKASLWQRAKSWLQQRLKY